MSDERGRAVRPPSPAGVLALRSVLVAATSAYVVSVLPGVRPEGSSYLPWLDFGLTTLVMLLSAGLCAVRAVATPAERATWTWVVASIVVYLLGNAYYYLRLVDLPADLVPYPSLADAGWLGWYPFLAVGVLLLVRTRSRGAAPVLWLDGLTAGAGAAALAGALFLQPLLEVGDGGGALLVLTNLAYPVADLALLTVVTLVFHLNGWRPDRTWRWIGAAAITLMVGDSVYMLQLAAGTYTDGGLLDASWTVVCACLAMGAATPVPEAQATGARRPTPAVPAVFSLAGTAVLFSGATEQRALPLVVGVLGLLSVLLASMRLLLTVREARRLADAHREARTDELTGLPNRRELMHRLGSALADGQVDGTLSAVLLIDLDRFKEVNDTLGHHHGDQLLRAVAERLADVFRDGDTVARLGGDEFAVLLPDVADLDAARALGRRCDDALEDDFTIDGLHLHVDASVGLAVAPLHAQDVHGLMRAADVAMYEAKARPGEVVVYDPSSDLNTPHRLAMLGELRRAIQGDELVLHYQPKLELVDGRVTAVEALVRWQHPVRGLLPPADFVPAAETTGLIMPLTLRTLSLAIGDAVRWREAGHELQVAVNLSPRCLLEPGLPEQIRDMLAERGLPAHLLRLELTESTVMVDPVRSLAVLRELSALGVRLSIDDFGTGYSSMTYLKKMPVDELKIDRSFVMDMLASPDDEILVRSSIELAHNLGMSIVAEGVEDAETFDALSTLRCDVVQGYHLAYPMGAGAVLDWLEGRGVDARRAREAAPVTDGVPTPRTRSSAPTARAV
ncbi:putative bifunctional diguanylate cyclase/phosphodiesterase [Cellulomonas aerilata]|nr:EAL domain-containing protein [Cellulomonas aerilata]